jgi:hypothetical protein
MATTMRSAHSQHDDVPKHRRRGSIGERLKNLRRPRSRDQDDVDTPNTDDVVNESIEGKSIFGYEEAVPSPQRDSLGEHYEEAAPPRRRYSMGKRIKGIRKGKSSKRSTNATVDETSLHGYEGGASSRRRNSLGDRIEGIRKSKSDISSTGNGAVHDSLEERTKYASDEAAPSRRRNSLERIKGIRKGKSDKSNTNETVDEASIYGYDEVIPSRRRNRSGERIKGKMKGKSNKNSTKATVDETKEESLPHDYEEAAPSRRRNSLGERIKGFRKGKSNKKGIVKVVDESSEGRSPDSYEEVAPSRRSRNSLKERIVYWTGAVKKEYSEKAVAEEGDRSRSGSADTNGEVEEDEKAAHTPHRRSSLADRIMVWAGTVNQEHCNDINPPHTGPRRASIDFVGQPDFPPDADSMPEDIYPEDDYSSVRGRATRRNSLHAMVERAMIVNMKPEKDEELCAFGTRRDSLF